MKSGQQTRLASVFHSVFLLASMFLLGGVMARLPLAALCRRFDGNGVAHERLGRHPLPFQPQAKIRHQPVPRHDARDGDLLTWTVAILLGVAYSAILYIAKSSQIGVSFSDIDANKLRTVEGKPPVLETTGVVYVTGSLFFGAVDEFNRRMAEMPAYDHVIFPARHAEH